MNFQDRILKNINRQINGSSQQGQNHLFWVCICLCVFNQSLSDVNPESHSIFGVIKYT